MSQLAYELDDRSLAEISGGEVSVGDYQEELDKRLAFNGLTLLRYAARMASQGRGAASKIARRGIRAPVSPDLPEVRARLERAIHERAPEVSLVELLTVYEPMLEDALEHYRKGN